MSTDAADTRYETDAPSLVIISGNDSGRRIPVPSMGIVLGREGKLASLFRDDPLVSRGHAHIYLAEDHSVQVADLNSTNGTFVNGKAIRSLTRLTDRDVLRIGSIGMRLDSPRADNRPADETVRMPPPTSAGQIPSPGDGPRPEHPGTTMAAGTFPRLARGRMLRQRHMLARANLSRHQRPSTRLPTCAPAGRIRSLSG